MYRVASRWTSFLALAFVLFLQPKAGSAEDETHHLMHGGQKRSFLLHVPAKLTRDQPAPLVLVFHGGGSNAKAAARSIRFQELADREGFLVAYPDAIGNNWNDGREDTSIRAQRDKIDDLGFVDAVITASHRRQPVDPKRIYATGISNGGIFAHYLAGWRSERIAAIAPVVGGLAEPFHKQFKPGQPVSVLMLQGTADPLVPYAGGWVTKSKRGKIIGTDEAARTWAKHNGCQHEPKQEAVPDKDPKDGCTVVRSTWSGGRAGTEVVLYKIMGGGHTWPGGEQYLAKFLIGPVCRDFDATEVIWEFFKQHPKP